MVIGDTGSGKSSILLRFADDDFAESYMATVAVDFRHRTLQIGGKSCKLQIWDSAGQERYRTITSAYYRGADAIILVYDVTNTDSMRHISDWLIEVQRYAAPDACMLLIGNKCDLETKRAVTRDKAEEFAKSLGISVIETSAKDGSNVDQAVIQLTEELMAKKGTSDPPKKSRTGGVKVGEGGKSRGGKCC